MVIRRNIIIGMMGVGMLFSASARWNFLGLLRNKVYVPGSRAFRSEEDGALLDLLRIKRITIKSPGLGPIANHYLERGSGHEVRKCNVNEWRADSDFPRPHIGICKSNDNQTITFDVSRRLMQSSLSCGIALEDKEISIKLYHPDDGDKDVSEWLFLPISQPYAVIFDQWPKSRLRWLFRDEKSRDCLVYDYRKNKSKII